MCCTIHKVTPAAAIYFFFLYFCVYIELHKTFEANIIPFVLPDVSYIYEWCIEHNIQTTTGVELHSDMFLVSV